MGRVADARGSRGWAARGSRPRAAQGSRGWAWRARGIPARRSHAATETSHLIDRMLRNVEHGRFERSLSGLTAVAALVTTAEIYLEHYRASFGNKWMWSPVLVTPPLVVAGVGGVFSRRWAKTVLPVVSGVYLLNGVLGEYFHARGVRRRPGGWRLASYNLPMGPPIFAPGLMCVVGGMGLLAAVLRRER
jgi:hypothetical protein